MASSHPKDREPTVDYTLRAEDRGPVRQSTRQRNRSEKGKSADDLRLLITQFQSHKSELLKLTDHANQVYQQTDICEQEMNSLKQEICRRWEYLQELNEAHGDLIDETLEESVSTTIAKIIQTIGACRSTALSKAAARSIKSARSGKSKAVSQASRISSKSNRQMLQVQLDDVERKSKLAKEEAEIQAAELALQEEMIAKKAERQAKEVALKKEALAKQAEIDAHEEAIQRAALTARRKELEREKQVDAKRTRLKTELAALSEEELDFDDGKSRGNDFDSEAGDSDASLAENESMIHIPRKKKSTFKKPRAESVCSASSDLSVKMIEALTKAISTQKLPPTEPDIFTGDPLKYPDWIHSFNAIIDSCEIPDGEKILYLKRYLGGPAKEAVSGYFILRSKNAYLKAKEVLEKRYGNDHAVSEAFRNKLEGWAKIGSKDRTALRSFGDFLSQCLTAKKEVSGLEYLDDCRQVKNFSAKLPDWLFRKWINLTASTKVKKDRYPNFKEFCKFVNVEAEIMNDPFLLLDSASERRPDPKHEARRRQVMYTSQDSKPNQSSLADTSSRRTQAHKESQACSFCKKGHPLLKCYAFAKKSEDEKVKFVKDEGLCFGCLQSGHRSKRCQNRATCKHCKLRHPTCLHSENPKFKNNITQKPEDKSKSTTTGTSKAPLNTENSNRDVGGCGRVAAVPRPGLTSMIVPVLVSSASQPTKEVPVYAIMDTGSDSTFITHAVLDQLEVSSIPTNLLLTTMTNSETEVKCQKIAKGDLCIRGLSSTDRISLPQVFSRDDIPLDKRHISTPATARQWPHLRKVAHLLSPAADYPIGLLIGYNCPKALAPIEVVCSDSSEAFAIKTALGWSIVGGSVVEGSRHDSFCQILTLPSVASVPNTMQSASFVFKSSAKENFSHELEKAFEVDFRDSDEVEKKSVEDCRFMNILNSETKQRPDGFYELPIPFRNGPPELVNNRSVAYRRLMSLKKKFETNHAFKEHYMDFMRTILEQGEAELVSPSDTVSTVWYIPHHGVYHPHKPNKIRVVFDCSARFGGTSLNDHLLQGPDLMNSLFGVLLRFRESPVAFSCDIQRMFHQFRVVPSHQDYFRFLWWTDDDFSKPPVDFRMKVHIFGATSSPGCANFALKRIAQDHQNICPLAANFLLRHFYVDDGLKSEETVNEAKKVLDGARQICAAANLKLHKIKSNVVELQENDTKELSESECPIEKALGLHWCTATDTFRFKIDLKERPATRRGMLSTVASIYDPLGFIAPFILQGRVMLQRVCEENLSWDQAIPASIQKDWDCWKTDVMNLNNLAIPRCIKPCNFGSAIKVEVHHFSDASLRGYGQCSYLRLKNAQNQIHCSLLTAKAKVSPLKSTTVPRLELQAAVLSTRVAQILSKELDYKDLEHFFWTDSKVVLGYIQNESARFHIFVANRVEQIRQVSNPSQWRYVPTQINPADHASRGLAVDQLTTSNWFCGPEFLWKELNLIDTREEVCESDPEVKSKTVLVTKCDHDQRFSSFEERIGRFSSLAAAVSAFSVIVRCCAKLKGISMSRLESRQRALDLMILSAQHDAYGKLNLQSKGHPLRDLDPYVNEKGMLRVGGRLRRAEIQYGVKHPVILPKSSHLSKLLVLDLHSKVAHQGRNFTINEIRSSGYWIVGCRALVMSLLRQCVTCARIRGFPRGQKMADLPKERLQDSPPFTYCGIDLFGPFIVREGRKELKRYGLIFTCLALRAIHIEILDDMSTDSFLNGLRCFIALRGKVRLLFCDRGSNFLGAKHELKENLKLMNWDSIQSKLADSGCEFKFNPPASSHMGGVWERQIRTVRTVFAGLLDSVAGRLDSSTLRTLMYEAMAIVNSRPLSVQSLEHSEGPLPLTPNHLLTQKSGVVVPPPPGVFVKEDVYLRRRWKQVQHLTNVFWERWRKEYLQTLQARVKWQDDQPNFSVGDIVLLQDDAPRCKWPLARIVKVYPSEDGLVRSVQLQMATSQLDRHGKPVREISFLDRPVHKLIPLVISSEVDC